MSEPNDHTPNSSRPSDNTPADSTPPGEVTGGRVPTTGVPAGTPRTWLNRRIPLIVSAAGLALLLAVVAGVAVGRMGGGSDKEAGAGAAAVPETGHTTTVQVTMKGMSYEPDHVELPAGDRLIVELTNTDKAPHDLVLPNGKRSKVLKQNEKERFDAGIVKADGQAWCSLPGHRQAGMVMTITATGSPRNGAPANRADPGHAAHVDMKAKPAADFKARDAAAPARENSTVHKVTFRVQEVELEVAPGVKQKMWTFNGTAPGPVLRGQVGDTFEVTLINDGRIEHSIDFHAGMVAPDKPMRSIAPGESLVYTFTANHSGVWMYHCGTAPMLHHVGNGMYGAVIIDPPGLGPVAKEYVLVQSEFYLGPQGAEGDLAKMRADQPDAVVFNGYVNQYAHRPLTAKVGDRVRVWVLDAGPSRGSSFHIVGTQFDTVWKEGRYELRPDGSKGGAQVLPLTPAEGGFVEMEFLEAGSYAMVTHSIIDIDRGAKGVIQVS